MYPLGCTSYNDDSWRFKWGCLCKWLSITTWPAIRFFDIKILTSRIRLVETMFECRLAALL